MKCWMETAKKIRLGYLVSRFPDYSEGFVRYELAELSKLLGPTPVFALVKLLAADGRGDFGLGPEQRVVRPPRFFSSPCRRAWAYCVKYRPKQLAAVLFEILRFLPVAPTETVKWLALFPRMLVFGLEARRLALDHVHAHFTALPAAAAWTMNMLFSVPYSASAHAYDFAQPAAMLRLKMSRALFGAAETRLAAAAAARYAPPFGAFAWHVVRNGIPLEFFKPVAKTGPAHPRLRILSVGRLVPKKGFPVLLEALAILLSRGLDVECRIIGDGPMRGGLQAQARGLGLGARLEMPGVRLGADLVREYAEADIFILPCLDLGLGRSDMLPVALIEAMAMELPVVSCTVAAVPELVRDGENGLLTPPSDAAALVGAVERLVASPALRLRLGRAAGISSREAHDIRKTAAQLLELIAGAHASRRQSEAPRGGK